MFQKVKVWSKFNKQRMIIFKKLNFSNFFSQNWLYQSFDSYFLTLPLSFDENPNRNMFLQYFCDLVIHDLC